MYRSKLSLPIKRLVSLGAVAAFLAGGILATAVRAGDDNRKHHGQHGDKYFRRIATFPVFQNTEVENEAVSEIVAATPDGMTLVYTDSALEKLGFIDITNPHKPIPDGVVDLDGEPTSVTVVGPYALACINTSADFVNTSGDLVVIDTDTRQVVRTLPLGGQPDAIAASPDGRYAAIAIENERDEDLGDGRPPQLPAGFVVIVDLAGDPADWATRVVDLVGVADKFPEDPEPEFVDINADNTAVVTLQENNHIVLIRLSDGQIIDDYYAGDVDLNQVDTVENDLIEQNASLGGVPREADAVAWIDNSHFATADEGDLDGGSRGFTIYNQQGQVLFTSGNNDDWLTAMTGHYPEDRSENKGNEPEGAEFGLFGNDPLLFIGSERSSVVSVYNLNKGPGDPRFVQVLPTNIGPEGLLAIPSRDLFVVASEEDSRGDKFRSSITIYKRDAKVPTYPTVVSEDRKDGTPIPWAALSALAADTGNSNRAWTVYDSFYRKSRIFEMDVSDSPALIRKEIVLKDTFGVFETAVMEAMLDGSDYDEGDFLMDVDSLINDDGTINVDPEGLAKRRGSGFWVASEGNGSVNEDDRPIRSYNWLLKVLPNGSITQVVDLPDSVNAKQRRFGFEGVASVGSGRNETVYVCFQREWPGDPSGLVRIGRYETRTGEWSFAYYPLDGRESPNGGWVGLSEIVSVGWGRFLVIERDNQAGTDARIKKIYRFSTRGVTFKPDSFAGEFDVVAKYEVMDLLPALQADNGAVIEKVEGLMVTRRGEVFINTDNDGVDDSSGETQMINLGRLR